MNKPDHDSDGANQPNPDLIDDPDAVTALRREWVDPFDDPWNSPDCVLDGANHPNLLVDDPLLEAVLNEMTGSEMKLPEHAITSAFRQPAFAPMPRPYSPSRAVIDGAGKMRRGR